MAPPCIMIGTVSNYVLILLEATALLPINCTLSLMSFEGRKEGRKVEVVEVDRLIN